VEIVSLFDFKSNLNQSSALSGSSKRTARTVIRLAVLQPTEWQSIGNQIDARDAGFDQAGLCVIRIAKEDRFLQRFGVRQFKSKALLVNIALLVETLASSLLPASALRWPEILGLDAFEPLVFTPLVFAQPSKTSQLLYRKGRTQFTRQKLPASRTAKLMRLFRARADAAEGIVVGDFSFH
jgi:hypothetical protein